MSKIVKFTFGKTRSRAPIFYIPLSDHKKLSEQFDDLIQNYSQTDIFDAYCAIEHLIRETFKKNHSDSEQLFLPDKHRRTLMKMLDSQFFEAEKKRLKIITSLDICNFGSKLVKFEFKNF